MPRKTSSPSSTSTRTTSAAALGQAPQARSHRDFRELFGGRLDDIDAVFVSTTEHTHAFATLPALRAG
jgi:predicted dehydrogenase